MFYIIALICCNDSFYFTKQIAGSDKIFRKLYMLAGTKTALKNFGHAEAG